MDQEVDQRMGRMAGLVALGLLLAGCAMSGDLGRDAFVGDWQCGDERVALTAKTITRGDGEEKIAWIESGKNADFDLFTTRGARYSIYDQRRNSLTLFAHASDETSTCTRIA